MSKHKLSVNGLVQRGDYLWKRFISKSFNNVRAAVKLFCAEQMVGLDDLTLRGALGSNRIWHCRARKWRKPPRKLSKVLDLCQHKLKIKTFQYIFQ